MYVYVIVCVCGSQRLASGVFLCCFPPLTEPGAGLVAHRFQRASCVCLPRAGVSVPSFSHRFWGPKLGPHACVDSTLLSCLWFLKTCIFFFLRVAAATLPKPGLCILFHSPCFLRAVNQLLKRGPGGREDRDNCLWQAAVHRPTRVPFLEATGQQNPTLEVTLPAGGLSLGTSGWQQPKPIFLTKGIPDASYLKGLTLQEG